MFLLDGKRLPLDKAFTHAGIQYPKNWLRLTTLAEKEAIGIVEVPDPPNPSYDQRFYWGYDADGHLIPKDHGELVKTWISNTRQTANSLLTPTDWMVVREADNGTTVNSDWKMWREAVRHAANEKVLYIGTTNDTPDLAAYITGTAYPVWPNDPDHPPVVAADDSDDGVGTAVDGEDAGLSDTIDFSSSTTSAGIV
jgi:hypothetical protein